MRIKKSALTLALAIAVVFGIMIGANAADTVKTITATLNYGITIKYNGNVQEMKDANGNTVYPISYEGTTYLPIRAVSNMLGIEVNWDGPTQTVWLGEGFVATPIVNTDRTPENNYGIEVPPGCHIEINRNGKYVMVDDATGYREVLGGLEGYEAGTGQITSDPVDLPDGWGFTNN